VNPVVHPEHLDWLVADFTERVPKCCTPWWCRQARPAGSVSDRIHPDQLEQLSVIAQIQCYNSRFAVIESPGCLIECGH
jgi:hypothetical protein